MLEDFRNHDPRPDAQERAWMQANPLPVLARVVALTALAVAIGTAASNLGSGANQPAKAKVVVAR
ncbi:MAG TPA: hypothetical protein VII36_05035 [Usitatibacter sp.]|jgi:hypothetical protein